MACGDKYAGLVVTTSGLNLKNPWDNVATFNDYEEWQQLARRLSTMAYQRWQLLGEVEGAKTGGASYPRYNELQPRNNTMVERYDALPSFFTTSPEGSISDAQAVIADAVCLMELSDEGIAAYGGTVPATPGLTPPPRGVAGKEGLGNALGFAVGVVVLALILRGRR